MGYTHYYKGWLTMSEALREDIKAIIAASDVTVRNGLGEDEPIIDEDEVLLNGDASKDEDCETLWLVHGVNHSSFCKTGRQPYDEVVGAILLRAEFRSQRFTILSDGSWESDWEGPRELYAKTFGLDPLRPSTIRP